MKLTVHAALKAMLDRVWLPASIAMWWGEVSQRLLGLEVGSTRNTSMGEPPGDVHSSLGSLSFGGSLGAASQAVAYKCA